MSSLKFVTRAEDAGDYTCQVATKDPMEQTFTIEIKCESLDTVMCEMSVRKNAYFQLPPM